MAGWGRSGADNIQSRTTDETKVVDELIVEQININDSAEQTGPKDANVPSNGVNHTRYVLIDGAVYVAVETAKRLGIAGSAETSFTERVDSEDANVPHEGGNRTISAVTGGTTLGAAGVAVETARRLGTERHAEAGFAEQAHARAYAKKVNGMVVNDGSSAFTPDGGIDSIIETASGQKHVQSKHYGQAVGNSTLEQYAGDIDAIGATNGVTESADPEGYGMDVITANDWSWRAKAELQGRRVIHGCRKGIAALEDGTHAVASHLINGAKFVRRWAVAGGKWLCQRLVKLASAIGTWFARRSLGTQLFLIVAGVGLLYFLWRWNTSKDEEDSGRQRG